jgi:hypothetical protein
MWRVVTGTPPVADCRRENPNPSLTENPSPSLRQHANRLDPAKHFFDSFPFPLTHLKALMPRRMGGRPGSDALKAEAPQIFQMAETDVAELRDLFAPVGAGMNSGRRFKRNVDGLAGRTAGRLEMDDLSLNALGDRSLATISGG